MFSVFWIDKTFENTLTRFVKKRSDLHILARKSGPTALKRC